ncbi:MAG: CtsR family transcriptional regulator [Clostridia bacterium]|nr:CtsR family transcriptional regulator [Clostridia bacterium]
MARLSDVIEDFIKALLKETDTGIEIQRNELATYFKCVPSQINYVIGTRFTAEKGYFVESKRGGGGYISIKSVSIKKPYEYLMHIILSMGDEISQQSAEIYLNNFVDYNIITKEDSQIIKAAISNGALRKVDSEKRDMVRVDIFKNIMMSMIV